MSGLQEAEARIERLNARFRFWARVRRVAQRMCERIEARLRRAVRERNRIAPIGSAKEQGS